MSENAGMLAPLRQRPFRLLFSGQVVSNLGDWLDYIALILIIVYTWHHGPPALAALAVVIAIPWVVIAPIAGVWVDRWPKKPVLIACDLARAGIVFAFIFAPNVYVLLTLVALKTVFSTIFAPAEQAAIRATVSGDALLAANSLLQLSLQGTKVVGPALGGIIVAVSSPRVVFALDALTFLLSAAILLRLPRLEIPAGEEAEEEEGGVWNEFRAGLSYVVQRRALALAIASISAAVFLVFMFDTLSPLALQELGLDASALGFAIGGIGAGAVVGTLAIGQWGSKINPFGLMGAAKVVTGVLVALIGAAAMTAADIPQVAWIPVVFGIGVASAGVLVAYPTILQLETPPQLMGRVSAVGNSVPTVLQLVAPLLGAAVAEWQSVGLVLVVAGGGLALLGAAVIAVRPPVGVGVPGVEARRPVPAPPRVPITGEWEVVGFIDREEGGAV